MFGLERTLQMALKISFLQWDSEGLYCNGAMYQDLLEKNLLPSTRTMRMNHMWTLQQDINPKQTVSWFQGRKIKVLEVPCSHSPDWRSRYTSSPPKIYVKSHPNTERDGFVVQEVWLKETKGDWWEETFLGVCWNDWWGRLSLEDSVYSSQAFWPLFGSWQYKNTWFEIFVRLHLVRNPQNQMVLVA